MTHRIPEVLLLAVLLQACATPIERLHATARSLGFVQQTLAGEGFLLTAYYKHSDGPDRTLHVYLEGDGTPWLTPERVAPDPTPRNPLMLRLMGMDRSAALYLGRPCYNGHATDAGCSALLWTQRRYASEVVSAMSVALRNFLNVHPYADLVFAGHSGGGVLAMLMARHFPQTRLVTTLAAPLDIDAWTDHHDYSRLDGSLNPMDSAPAEFQEIHYFGAMDERTPPILFAHALARRPHARVIVMDRFDHACCWEQIWPEILRQLPPRLAGL
ncbi:MAG: uncharacterized protein H6R26_244 [Proteobacteria bacterium]|nr:uncharacterized protein [Pseudomonadota bacterium]